MLCYVKVTRHTGPSECTHNEDYSGGRLGVTGLREEDGQHRNGGAFKVTDTFKVMTAVSVCYATT